MDDVRRRILQEQRQNIIRDLDVNSILDALYSKDVITESDRENINNQVTQRDKTCSLLDILPIRGNNAYDTFVNVLKKDHIWLYEGFQNLSDGSSRKYLEEQIFIDATVLGDLPRLPRYHVERVGKKCEVRNNLRNLKRGERLVVYGPVGRGKSCLALSVIRDKTLLQESFHNRVYWINLGETKTSEELLLKMNSVYMKLVNDPRDPNIQWNFDTNIQVSVSLIRDQIKNVLFSKKEALLVLDNVSMMEAVDAFDVGCKIFITTQNKNLVDGANTKFVQVNSGFTENESLTLFANCLSTSVNNLPLEANTLHALCKGDPILVALIGSLLETNKEDLLNNSGRWKYYIEKIKNKEYNLSRVDESKNQLFRTIKLCIENLSPSLRAAYQDLAVFVDDINIMPEVLEKLWNVDKYMVEDTMRNFENKSLIVVYYNHDLNTYIYCIHDLFLHYLKKQISLVEKVNLHKKLINAYKQISNDNYANLPNDNYIFQYIGYHLNEAELFMEFGKMYFDLNFIGAKIKAVGHADLLKDYELYKKHITNNDDFLNQKLDVFIEFVKVNGQNLHKYKYTDIIQCGLQQSNDSIVYKTAKSIALQNPDVLYLQFQDPKDNMYVVHTLEDEVTVACFTANIDQILVGTITGDIHLWDHTYKSKLHTFSGHKDRIRYLQLSCDGEEFLSISEEGIVNIWTLKGSSTRNSGVYLNSESESFPSPRLKQASWQSIYGKENKIENCKTFSCDKDFLISASYSNNEMLHSHIVTGSQAGTVSVWNTKTEELTLKILGNALPASCVTFSCDDSIIICSYIEQIVMYSTNMGKKLHEVADNDEIIALLILSDNSFISLTNFSFNLWSWQQNEDLAITGLTKSESPVLKNKIFYGVVTYDGEYLVTGSSDQYIRMWNIDTGKIVKEFLYNKGTIVCLDIVCTDDITPIHILLTSTSAKTVEQWHIQPSNIDHNDAYRRLPTFNVYWKRCSSVPRIAVAQELIDQRAFDQKVQILNGQSLLSESKQMLSSIKAVCFSSCGNKVALGLENGNVIEFNIKTLHTNEVMTLHKSVTYLKYFNESTNKTDIVYQNGDKNKMKESIKNNNASEILVAASENGCFMICRNNVVLRVQEPHDKSSSRYKQIASVVQCFYLNSVGQLLSVFNNRSVKLLVDGYLQVLIGNRINRNNNSHVTATCLSNDESLLAMFMTDCVFEVHSLHLGSDVLSATYSHGKTLDSPSRSCCFSHNGKILATGQENGNIVLWSIEQKITITTLSLHKTAVRYLLFSPAPDFILISIGEQIAFWNVSRVYTELTCNSNNRKSFRGRSNSIKKILTIDISTELTNISLGPWVTKKEKSNKPYLLSAVKLRGDASYISASYDFATFLTIDCNGFLYIMKMLNS